MWWFRVISVYITYRMNKNTQSNLQKVNEHNNRRKIFCTDIGLLRCGFRITNSWQLKNMFEVSTFSHKAGCYTSEKWLPDWLEDYRYSTNLLYSILYSLLEDLEVTEFCIINNRLQFSPAPFQRAVGPPCFIHCSENTLFKNSGNERPKCGGAPQSMNQKWIIACRSTFCNSSGRTFLRKSR